jgi:uncharacterized protein
MERDEIIRLLTEHGDEIRQMGVKSLSLFGSVARSQAGPESDVDLLVEFLRPVGIFEFLDLKEHLEVLLGRRVDLTTLASLKERTREEVLREAVHVG